ncbi:MAG TPA: lytic transglycosylase domain-containing protein [Candidatus Baltobacteraceae bacterium]|nr:lytic transglycosylase domain-containing protein [Candidatus Baltobacteraceae bacterium]
MDISSELAAVASRIEQITGSPVQLPGLPAPGPTDQTSSFAAMLQAQMNSGEVDSSLGDVAGAADAPAMIPPAQIDSLVGDNAEAQDVDPALLKAIIANESGFNANATSKVGAQGLMQLMPATAAALGVTNAYDPAQNVAGGTKYIKGLLDRFNGDVRLAVAAYNAGPGAVEKYGGVPPYAETQNYVQNVLASYAKYRASDTP